MENDNRKKITALCSRLAKRERYLSKKDPARPEVSVGNIREIVGYICDEIANDPCITGTLLSNGLNRKNKKAAK